MGCNGVEESDQVLDGELATAGGAEELNGDWSMAQQAARSCWFASKAGRFAPSLIR